MLETIKLIYYMPTAWLCLIAYVFLTSHWLLCGISNSLYQRTNMLPIMGLALASIAVHWFGYLYYSYIIMLFAIALSVKTVA